MKDGKQAVIDLRLKCGTEMQHKSFLYQKTDAIAVLDYVEELEAILKELKK